MALEGDIQSIFNGQIRYYYHSVHADIVAKGIWSEMT